MIALKCAPIINCLAPIANEQCEIYSRDNVYFTPAVDFSFAALASRPVSHKPAAGVPLSWARALIFTLGRRPSGLSSPGALPTVGLDGEKKPALFSLTKGHGSVVFRVGEDASSPPLRQCPPER